MKKIMIVTIAVSVLFTLCSSALAISPQPEPPSTTIKPIVVNPIVKVTINPQPEPPGVIQ